MNSEILYEVLGSIGAIVFIACICFYTYLETLRFKGADVDNLFRKHIDIVNIVWIFSMLLTLYSVAQVLW